MKTKWITSVAAKAACAALVLSLAGANASAQMQTLLEENFDGTWAQMQTDGWTRMSYNTTGAPGSIDLDDGAGKAMRFNNIGLKKQFAQPGTAFSHLEISTNWLVNNYSRSVYVVLASAPDVDGKISGYGIVLSSASENQFDGHGYYVVRKLDGIDESSMGAVNPGGSNISSLMNTGITFLPDGVGTNPVSVSQFGTVRMTWNNAGEIRVYIGGSESPAISITDTDFSSFSTVYISGNSAGFFESLTIAATPIPEPAVVSLVTALAALGGAAFVRQRLR